MHFIRPVWFYKNLTTYALWIGLGVAGGTLPCQYQPPEVGKGSLGRVVLRRRLP